MKRYWLFKSEPDVYSIGWLKKEKRADWTGVRNYTARNFLRDKVRKGDGVLYYHSSCAEPGVAGLAEVTQGASPDPTQFDPKSPYFDPKSAPNAPRWFQVQVAWKATAKKLIPGKLMKEIPALSGMALFKVGRLSVTPVSAAEWKAVMGMKEHW